MTPKVPQRLIDKAYSALRTHDFESTTISMRVTFRESAQQAGGDDDSACPFF
jgi:hypothetical protein